MFFPLKNDERKKNCETFWKVENCSDRNLKPGETDFPNSPMFCYKIMENTHVKYLWMYICRCELFLFIWCTIVQ